MNIVYIKLFNSSFIKIDEKILKENYNLKTFLLRSDSPFNFFMSIVRLILFLTYNVFWADIYYTRFADYHASILTLFSKIFFKKQVIVIGGYDVASIPDLKYGVHINKLRSRLVKYALKYADLLLPNAEALVNYESNFRDKTIKGGITNFVRNPNGIIKVVKNGFDTDFWINDEGVEKEMIALTVGRISDLKTFKRKGIDYFIEVAKALPKYNFIIVGMSKSFIKKHKLQIPSNVIVIDFLHQSELVNYYLKAKVFCLFTIHEGMPNVLCEAMLCKCIPVGSNVISIPEIIGDTGLIVNKQNLDEMIAKVDQAFSKGEEFGERAKSRITENFNLRNREMKILEAINQLNVN